MRVFQAQTTDSKRVQGKMADLLFKDFLMARGYQQVVRINTPQELANYQGNPQQKVIFIVPAGFRLMENGQEQSIPHVNASGTAYTIYEDSVLPSNMRFITQSDGTTRPLSNMPADPRWTPSTPTNRPPVTNGPNPNQGNNPVQGTGNSGGLGTGSNDGNTVNPSGNSGSNNGSGTERQTVGNSGSNTPPYLRLFPNSVGGTRSGPPLIQTGDNSYTGLYRTNASLSGPKASIWRPNNNGRSAPIIQIQPQVSSRLYF